MTAPLLLLGFGDVGRAVLREARARRVVATTRNAARVAEIAGAGAEPLLVDADAVAAAASGADVIVSFPPDGVTDARLAPACRSARAIAYVSSTGVYGTTSGRIDATTPARPGDPRAESRLLAEAIWRDAGGTVLRAPALYGPGNGLHVRLRGGGYRLPGDGSGVVSRIHTHDLAALLLAALARGSPGTTYLVGDRSPTPHVEVVGWLCERLGLAMPPSVPISEAPVTLRGSRAVDASQALAELDVTLRYPTYREGYEAILAADTLRSGS